MSKEQKSPLWLMALTILIDFTGFGLIIPLLPFLAQKLGASAFGVGLLLTFYALAQFLFTPVLGALSDRYGRKPVIVASLLIETGALALTALSGLFWMLLIARFIGGLGASNIGSAQAVVADVTTAKERARGMGLIGAAIGLGFVLGPALGGLLAPLGLTVPFWVAAGVAAINALLVLLLLPETRKKSAGTTQETQQSSLMLAAGWRSALRQPVILRLVLINFLFTLAFTGMETIFPLFSQQAFGWGASQNGYVFTYIGVIIVIMQGGIVAQLVKQWSEQKVMIAGLVVLAIGLILLAFSHQLGLMLIALSLLAIGEGAVTPTVSTLISLTGHTERQGETLGFSQGMAGVARSIAPLLAGAMFELGSAIPLMIGSLLVIVALLFATPRLPTTLEDKETESAARETVPAH